MTNGASYEGVYRAEIVNVIDPLAAGRVTVKIPFVQAEGADAIWAMPCVPYAGAGRGLFLSPEPGDAAWVMFEAGNALYPVWIGCYWEDGDRPSAEADLAVKSLRTMTGEVALDDFEGTVRIKQHTEGPENSSKPVDVVLESNDGVGIKLEGHDITFQGWPMKFAPAPPSGNTLADRVTAIEQAIASITNQPFPPPT